jgi:hypothetical protein
MKPGIPLKPADTSKQSRSLVKTLALTTFISMRAFNAHTSRIPGALHQAGKDIRDAWHESARTRP